MILLTVTKRGPTPDIARRMLQTMLRAAWTEVGRYWHAHLRPKHFTAAGAREYGYEPRKGERGARGSKGFRRSYTGKKLARFGHTRPLVLTGTTEGLTIRRDIRATGKGVRVVMDVPRYFLLTPRGSKINKAEELRRISPREAQTLVGVLDRNYQRQLDRHRGVVRRAVA